MTLAVGPCKKRCPLVELIDDPSTSDEEFYRAHEFISFVNKRFGGNRIVLNFLYGSLALWSPMRSISILDFRCGRGELAAAIARWAKSKNVDVRIYAVDPSRRVISLAKNLHQGLSDVITFDSRDADDPMFLQGQQFDYVVSNLALHHLKFEEAVAYLRRCDLLAKRGIIAVDWLRDFRAWSWMKALTGFWGDEIISRDGPLGIRKGFTLSEAETLSKKALLEYATVQKHFGYRFSISGERGMVYVPKMSPVQTGLLGT